VKIDKKKFFEVRVPPYDFEVKKFFYEIFKKLQFWCNFSRETNLAEPILIITHGSVCRVENSKKCYKQIIETFDVKSSERSEELRTSVG
jgi:hypothetical protein